MEASSDTRKRRAVVIHHCKAKADGQEQACEIVEVEKVPAASRGESRFDSVPDHKDCGEGTKKVLSHCVEEAEILSEQVVDGLKDELQIVHCDSSFDATSDLRRACYGIRKF